MITVLERVLEIFLEKQAIPNKKNPAKDNARNESAKNKFYPLDHEQEEEEEVDELEEIEEGGSKWALVAADKSTVIYEPAEPKNDVYFHIFNFFRLFDQLRTYTKQLWTDYQVGKVDLVVSCSLTPQLILSQF